MTRRVLLLLSVMVGLPVLAAGPRVAIVTGPDAPALEQLAAKELGAQFKALFDAEATVQTKMPETSTATVLIGSPQTNPAITTGWPKVSEQGQVLKSSGDGVLIVGGGSPVATLWAVYELGYQFGIRYLLQGDFLPVNKPAFHLDGFDLVLEPAFKTRAWNGFNGTLTGAECWAAEDHARLIGQLAKLKFTHYVVPEKTNAITAIRVDGDTAGRKAFKGAKEHGVTSSRPDEQIRTEAQIRGIQVVPEVSALVVALGAPTSSVLPQFSLRGLAKTVKGLRDNGTTGFVTSATVPGDLNAAVHFLSRASFGSQLTAESALNELVTPICGEGVYERLLKGFDFVEQAAQLIADHDAQIAVPAENLLLRHEASSEPPPAWWTEAKTAYLNAMNEMYRGNTRARDGARPFILYHAKRMEFAMQYFAALEAIRKAGNARVAKQADARGEALEQAVEAMYNALNAYGDVARDPSDRGVIALLNQFGYHRLVSLE